MRLPWISKKEHKKLMDYKDNVIKGWIDKCNKQSNEIDNKKDSIINLLDANKEFALENQHLRFRIKEMEDMVKWYQNNECELNKALHKKNGELDKIKNAYRMLTGEGE